MLQSKMHRSVYTLSVSVPRDVMTPIAVFVEHKPYPDVFCICQVHETEVKLRASARSEPNVCPSWCFLR